MKPWYQDELITVFHGDCADVAPRLGAFDLLLTDPPYGIGENHQRVASRGRQPFGGRSSGRNSAVVYPSNFGEFNWDEAPPATAVLDSLRNQCAKQIIWGGNYFALPSSPCWLVWDKQNDTSDFADCELAWTNAKSAVRIFRWKWNGMLQQNMKEKEKRLHPTQKPLPLMRWCIERFPGAQIILDPFAGSGTSLVAAKERGIKGVGIEREARYCEIIKTRLETMQLKLPIEKAREGMNRE